MADFKTVLEENREREKYRSLRGKLKLFIVLFSVIMLLMIFSDNRSIILSSPISNSAGLNLFMLFVLVGFYFWANGIPKTSYKGKKKMLQEFFYPSVTYVDNIPRSADLKHFRGKRYTSIETLFDFGKYTKQNGTKMLMLLFRDKYREGLAARIQKRENELSKAKSKREKNKLLKAVKSAEEALKNYDDRHKNSGVVTKGQEDLYRDLFEMLQGIYDSYTTQFQEKLEIDDKMSSPLKVYLDKHGNIGKIDVDTSIDVVRDGKVYFSIDAIMDTVKQLTFLYVTFLEKRVGRGRFYSMKRSQIARLEMFFKFFMTRRILKNYSNIPSGWLCVKLEDYTARAISSEVDRRMVASIDKKNDGTHPSYDSDVEMNHFLFTYWAFQSEPSMKKVFEEIDFIFDAAKEIHEIEARKIAREEEARLRAELEETYESISEDKLVYIDRLLDDEDEVKKTKEKLRELNFKYRLSQYEKGLMNPIEAEEFRKELKERGMAA